MRMFWEDNWPVCVLTGKDSYMLVPIVGIHYEYACGNGMRWR